MALLGEIIVPVHLGDRVESVRLAYGATYWRVAEVKLSPIPGHVEAVLWAYPDAEMRLAGGPATGERSIHVPRSALGQDWTEPTLPSAREVYIALMSMGRSDLVGLMPDE